MNLQCVHTAHTHTPTSLYTQEMEMLLHFLHIFLYLKKKSIFLVAWCLPCRGGRFTKPIIINHHEHHLLSPKWIRVCVCVDSACVLLMIIHRFMVFIALTHVRMFLLSMRTANPALYRHHPRHYHHRKQPGSLGWIAWWVCTYYFRCQCVRVPWPWRLTCRSRRERAVAATRSSTRRMQVDNRDCTFEYSTHTWIHRLYIIYMYIICKGDPECTVRFAKFQRNNTP